ncbi:MAG TPA: hypothetical protein VJQ83_00385 [Tepidiformaceae bacterium]|nr:hypothetical protein [Tepidiformaceae bacterium]
MKRRGWAIIGITVVLCGAGAFAATRSLTGGADAVQHNIQAGVAAAQASQGNSTPYADAPGTDETAAAAFAADAAQPRFTGNLGGIQFDGSGDGGVGPMVSCGTNAVTHPVFATVAGTPMDIFASGFGAGLSAGTGAPGTDGGYVAKCGATVIATDRSIDVSTASGIKLARVGRALLTAPWAAANFPSERASTITVGGQQMVVVRPVMADGRGESWVFWSRPSNGAFVVTSVNGVGTTSAELETVAAALARQDGFIK